jgi:hypothetical protein
MEVGKGVRLQPKASVNRGIMEAGVSPASIKILTEAGTLSRPSPLIWITETLQYCFNGGGSLLFARLC